MTNRTFRSVLMAVVIALALPVAASAFEVEVPDVVGLDFDTAYQEIIRHALIPEFAGAEFSETVDIGLVARQDPLANTIAESGTTVQFWISLGPAQAIVPLVVGQDLAAAESEIEAAGLTVGETREEYNEAPENTVIGQDPVAGTVVDPGTTVDLVVSKGPEPVLVPDVVGKSVSEAVVEIFEAGFTIGGIEYENADEPTNDVISQDPVGNSMAQPGTPVALVASKGPAVTIGGTVNGLISSGLVLQNTYSDDLSIEENGDFTFDTPRTSGTFYDVTVATNPTNPTQICSVENGSGTVPTEPVTDVVVTCAKPILSDVSMVAAEGDTLLDDTVLTDILLEGGVAINLSGNVAFGGRDEDGTDAVFTQDGQVVVEGDTLPDDTILAAFRAPGGVAIGSGLSGDQVAFHGQAESGVTDDDAVFTQAGRVATEGDILSDGTTLDEIEATGKVAINNFDLVAFHGQIVIEGSLNDQKLRAVFTSDGQTTQVAAQERGTLPDDTTVSEILEAGGVAINDFDEVAFHGLVVDPDTGGDTLQAVLSSSAGLIAKEGDTLEDGTIILGDIYESGGAAINLFGDVAFHGEAVASDTDEGDESPLEPLVNALFTQNGLVAAEGDTLPDGTTLDEILIEGGVAINLFGDVAFHGRTGGVKAVFISDGQTTRVLIKVGDNLSDGTTLQEIWEEGGVAIDPYSLEVAFHGGVDNLDVPGALVDAVFVGQAPVDDSDDTSSE